METLAITAPGPMEVIVILVIVVLLFGAKKLPELGSSVGKSIKNFKKGVADVDEDEAEETTAADEQQPTRDNT
jgi:sec-independent protein translocase protein TatA